MATEKRKETRVELPEASELNGPLVLAVKNSSCWSVAAVNPAALRLGIKPGLNVADARAWLPQLPVHPLDPAGDARDLLHLAEWATCFSPATTVDGSDGIMLEITGCAHLWGGEQKLLDDVAVKMRRLVLHHRAAIADTIAAAWALARFGSCEIQKADLALTLADLPPAALRLEAELCAKLERLGLRRIADLLALPRASLVRRFGEGCVQRLDQALGIISEALSPLKPPPQRYVRLDFAEPIGTRPDIDRALALLLKRLVALLQPYETGIRKLSLSCYRLDGDVQHLFIGTSLPSLDALHLQHLFESKLEMIAPGDGIEMMRLDAMEVDAISAQQSSFGKTANPSAELAPLIDRLSNRLGARSVYRPIVQESHIPERAVRFIPPLAQAPRFHWPKAAMRPLRLLPHPEPVEVVAPIPDDPPIQFRWRHVLHRVRTADGPERIAPEWWLPDQDDADIRDYYRVEDLEGQRFWLYRAGIYQADDQPRWYIHGLFG